MKHADIVFVHNKLRLKDPGTYMAPGIRSALNIENRIEGKQKIKYNHCGVVVEISGQLYFCQAGFNHDNKKAQVFAMPLDRWLYDRDPDSFLVKTPDISHSTSLFNERLERSIGLPYDFISVLILQPIRLASRRTLWFGPSEKVDPQSLYCSNFIAYLFGLPNWSQKDPQDIMELKFK